MLREVLELTNRHRSRQLVSWMSSTGLGLKMGGKGTYRCLLHLLLPDPREWR